MCPGLTSECGLQCKPPAHTKPYDATYSSGLVYWAWPWDHFNLRLFFSWPGPDRPEAHLKSPFPLVCLTEYAGYASVCGVFSSRTVRQELSTTVPLSGNLEEQSTQLLCSSCREYGPCWSLDHGMESPGARGQVYRFWTIMLISECALSRQDLVGCSACLCGLGGPIVDTTNRRCQMMFFTPC